MNETSWGGTSAVCDQSTGAKTVYTRAVIPSPATVSAEHISLSQTGLVATQSIDWYAFLKRARLPGPSVESLDSLRDKSILITGAGGSIGSELAVRLAATKPRSLVLLDASEQAIYRLTARLQNAGFTGNVNVVLGSVANIELIEEVFAVHQPQLVFHAAAHKHLPLLESHPFEAIANNTLATSTLVDCARCHGAPRLILLSTDKAVEPTSILGASKCLAEQIVLADGGIVVRLVNVLATEGSAVEVFLQQIKSHKPISLTRRDAERYFITAQEAVDLLLSTACHADAGDLLLPLIAAPIRVGALADFLRSQGLRRDEIEMHETGLRAGEKLRELLWSRTETPVLSSVPGTVAIQHKRAIQRGQSLLSRDVFELQAAVKQRDLSRVIEITQALVPDYSPSEIILALMQQSAHSVLKQ